MRFVERLWFLAQEVEVDVVTVELRGRAGPDLLHRDDVFPHQPPAPSRNDSVVAQLLAVPADADPEHDPGRRGVLDAGQLLGEHDRVARWNDADAGADPEPAGGHGGDRHRHDWIQELCVGLRDRPAARMRI
jgi:hypothetical protein